MYYYDYHCHYYFHYYCYLYYCYTLCEMHTETGGVRGDGRQNESGSVALARYDYLLLRVCDWTTR